MAIKARLGGDSLDLAALAQQFRDGDPQVSADSEGYYLTSSMFDGLMHDGGKLCEVASSLLCQANGVARVRSPGFRSVRLTRRFSGESGASLVVGAGSAELRFQASAAGVVVHEGQQQTPVPPGPKDIELAQNHPDVAEVLSVLGKDSPSLDWFDLYKVYEIVRDNVGGEAALSGKDWLPKRDIKAFTVSANRPDISGDQARHARSSGPPPKRTRPMTLSEAQQMIPKLVGCWLDSL